MSPCLPQILTFTGADLQCLPFKVSNWNQLLPVILHAVCNTVHLLREEVIRRRGGGGLVWASYNAVLLTKNWKRPQPEGICVPCILLQQIFMIFCRGKKRCHGDTLSHTHTHTHMTGQRTQYMCYLTYLSCHVVMYKHENNHDNRLDKNDKGGGCCVGWYSTTQVCCVHLDCWNPRWKPDHPSDSKPGHPDESQVTPVKARSPWWKPDHPGERSPWWMPDHPDECQITLVEARPPLSVVTLMNVRSP